jgi:hypothetical protein
MTGISAKSASAKRGSPGWAPPIFASDGQVCKPTPAGQAGGRLQLTFGKTRWHNFGDDDSGRVKRGPEDLAR